MNNESEYYGDAITQETCFKTEDGLLFSHIDDATKHTKNLTNIKKPKRWKEIIIVNGSEVEVDKDMLLSDNNYFEQFEDEIKDSYWCERIIDDNLDESCESCDTVSRLNDEVQNLEDRLYFNSADMVERYMKFELDIDKIVELIPYLSNKDKERISKNLYK